MISENQFLIGHLFPKLFNHLGINEIYQDPRQNFSLNISHNAIPRPLINTRYTPIFADYGFHDWFAKHLSKAWFHMDHYRQPTFSSITHYSYYQEVSRYSSWSHYGLHITPHRINSNSDVQFLAHFWEIPCNLLLSPNWSESSAYHPGTDVKLKSGPNRKRHAKILYHSLWQPRRQMPVFSRVLTQLSSKLENGTI